MRIVHMLVISSVLSIFFYGCAGMAHLKKASLEDKQVQEVRAVNLSKDQIFDKTIEWMAQKFNDSKSVIEVKDRNNGKIIGKGFTTFKNVYVNIPCRFTIIVDIKDKKYRVTYNHFIGMYGELQSTPIPLEYKEQTDGVKTNLDQLSKSLYSYLSHNEKTNW